MKTILLRVLRWMLYIIGAILGAAIIMLYSLSAWRNAQIPDDLRLFPEPHLSSFITGGYAFDAQATVDHYNHLFARQSATEIVRFLKENNYHVFFDAPDEISFIVSKNVMVFEYSAIIILKFNNGIFRESDVTAWGVK